MHYEHTSYFSDLYALNNFSSLTHRRDLSTYVCSGHLHFLMFKIDFDYIIYILKETSCYLCGSLITYSS